MIEPDSYEKIIAEMVAGSQLTREAARDAINVFYVHEWADRLAALRAGGAEPVAYQFKFTLEVGGWSDWTPCNQFVHDGALLEPSRFQARALYASPPASTSAWKTPPHVVGALERAVAVLDDEVRTLLAKRDYSVQFPEGDAESLRWLLQRLKHPPTPHKED